MKWAFTHLRNEAKEWYFKAKQRPFISDWEHTKEEVFSSYEILLRFSSSPRRLKTSILTGNIPALLHSDSCSSVVSQCLPRSAMTYYLMFLRPRGIVELLFQSGCCRRASKEPVAANSFMTFLCPGTHDLTFPPLSSPPCLASSVSPIISSFGYRCFYFWILAFLSCRTHTQNPCIPRSSVSPCHVSGRGNTERKETTSRPLAV